jgi:DNA sulfur modification protein DndD
MIRAEFERFLDVCDHDDLSIDERGLANLIGNQLEELVPLGTANGRRSKKLISLLPARFEDLQSLAPPLFASSDDSASRALRLHSLRVGPFRGFARREDFDLDSNLVLLYGPNGTGKSCFCEALELALLGTVQDSAEKRIEPEKYLCNARTGQFSHPELQVRVSDTEVIPVRADEDRYRFCFIEKNRIDDFSRIAATTPSQQTKLIAALFGIEEFDEFVRGFNADISLYIPTESTSATEMERLVSSLKAHQRTLDNQADALSAQTQQESELANSYRENSTLCEVIEELGTADNPGKIQQLQEQIRAASIAPTGFSLAELNSCLGELDELYQQKTPLLSELSLRSGEVTYRKLYEAITQLQTTNPDVCPACETPLRGTVSVQIDPYNRAREGLSALGALAQLEDEIERADVEIGRWARALREMLQTLSAQLNLTDIDIEMSAAMAQALSGADANGSDWWHKVLAASECYSPNLMSAIGTCAARCNARDSSALRADTEKARLQIDLDKLNAFREKAALLAGQRSTLETAEREARDAVSQSSDALELAAAALETEKIHNTRALRLTRAYASLIVRLETYKDSLPTKLLANLSETVMDLYNAFNRNDHPGDFISALQLPTSSGERIRFACASKPTEFFDALHVLSEGHIRCLGLAILVAKNIQTDCPVLIFDDPVNAIDLDHREGIRRTLFEDNFLRGKQIIVTSHGDEFLKDIQTLVGSEATSSAKRYAFLHHEGDNQIHVDSTSHPKNYVCLAEDYLKRGELRNALAESRRAIEVISNKIWQLVVKTTGVGISVKMKKATDKPELNNVVTVLRSTIGKGTFIHAKREQLLAGLDALLQSPQSNEWNYLNGGTHEQADREEFDTGTVRGIVTAAKTLDTLLAPV